jgi:hypothetical protein
MKMKRHCDLCDHQVLSLKHGNLCGVTNKKPNFNRTCVKIDFNNKLLALLEDILIESEDLKKSKSKVYKNFLSGSIIGVFLLVSSYFVFNFFLNKGFGVFTEKEYLTFFKSTAFIIMITSFILIPGYYFIKRSIDNLKRHKNQLVITENNKLEIEEVLKLYNQNYTSKVKFYKEIHGIQEVEIDVKLI